MSYCPVLPLYNVQEVRELSLVSIRIPGRSCLHDGGGQGAIPLRDCVLVRAVISHGQHALSSIHLGTRCQVYRARLLVRIHFHVLYKTLLRSKTYLGTAFRTLIPDPFPDPIVHFEFCSRSDVADGERVPPSSQGYRLAFQVIPTSIRWS